MTATISITSLELTARERVENRNFIDRDTCEDSINDDLFSGYLQITSTMFIEIVDNEMSFSDEGEKIGDVSKDLQDLIYSMLLSEKAEERECEASYRDQLETESYLSTASRNW